MKHRILILGSFLLLAACSAGGTKTVTGASGPPQTTPSGQSIPPPTPPANATWSRDSGINNNPPNMSHDQYCENAYNNPYNGGWITLCAGGKQDGSTGTWRFVHGAIWVETSTDPRRSGPESSPPQESAINEYNAPNSLTWVKIVSVTGDIVNLQREDGSNLTFNLVTRHFAFG